MPPKILDTKLVLDHALMRVKVETLDDNGRVFPYFYLESPMNSVATVALTQDGHIVLTRQYRHPLREVIFDLPAGRLNADEDPLIGAQRELEEETGYRAKRWDLLTKFNPYPGSLRVTTFIFLARDLELGAPHPDEGEDVTVHLRPFADVLAGVQHGEFIDATLQLGVLLADKRLSAQL